MRFWAKVDVRGLDECWEWQGWRLPRGYGHFRTTPADSNVVRTWLTHRLALVLDGRPVPEGMEASHTCANPPCCNPAHLVWESHGANLHRSPTAQFKVNAAKTHCKHGHSFDEANTITRLRKDGGHSRQCRTCLYDAVSRYQAKKAGGKP